MARKKNGMFKGIGLLTPVLALATIPILYVAIKHTDRKQKTERTRTSIVKIEKLIAVYFDLNGSYPPDEYGEEREYSVTGTSNAMLVKALSPAEIEIIPRPDAKKRVDIEFPEDITNDEGLLVDPWGNPYFYRENESKRWAADGPETEKGYLHNSTSYQLWSAGPDGMTDQKDPDAPENADDITNW